MERKILGIFIVTLLIATAVQAVGGLNYTFQDKKHQELALNGGWIKTYGGSSYEYGECVQQTSDGGYIMVIETTTYGSGDVDCWLVKTDAEGNIEWDTTIGDIAFDYPAFVHQTTDGGYLITGTTKSFGEGDNDAWLIKTDAVGNELWNKAYGGSDYDFGYSGFETIDGYIIGGGTNSFGAGNFDYWLVKTDFNGDEQWNKTYGASDMDLCRRMQQTSDGGYIISGYTLPSGSSDKSSCYLVKTDTDGNKIWDKHFKYKNQHTAARGIRQTSDGGYIISGETVTFGLIIGQYFIYFNGDMWLLKIGADGNKEWENTYGGTLLEDGAYGVEQTDDGGYIAVGFTKGIGSVIKQKRGLPTYSKAWVVETNADGDMINDKEYSRGICIYADGTSDGGHIVIGGENAYGEGDGFLIKIN
jgi:hypothetical protein